MRFLRSPGNLLDSRLFSILAMAIMSAFGSFQGKALSASNHVPNELKPSTAEAYLDCFTWFTAKEIRFPENGQESLNWVREHSRKKISFIKKKKLKRSRINGVRFLDSSNGDKMDASELLSKNQISVEDHIILGHVSSDERNFSLAGPGYLYGIGLGIFVALQKTDEGDYTIRSYSQTQFQELQVHRSSITGHAQLYSKDNRVYHNTTSPEDMITLIENKNALRVHYARYELKGGPFHGSGTRLHQSIEELKDLLEQGNDLTEKNEKYLNKIKAKFSSNKDYYFNQFKQACYLDMTTLKIK